MDKLYYVGLDIHKKIIAYCVLRANGTRVAEGQIDAARSALLAWMKTLPGPWIGGMEATMFTGWIYDFLKPFAHEVKVGHPALLKAIAAGKNKNDKLDARMLAQLLRAELFPEVYMAPREHRDLRRVLRFRNYLVRLATSLKNKSAGLLMECGQVYAKKKLHQKKYFQELMGNLEEVPDSVREMLRFDHELLRTFKQTQKRLLDELRHNPRLKERVERLKSIDGVGDVLALTWALEVGDPERFGSIRRAASYCGLCSGQHSSAGKNKRGPISKKRNPQLQHILVEAAKLAPRWNPQLAAVHQRELQRGSKNRATLAVARKLVAYLLAVDKSGRAFEPGRPPKTVAQPARG